MTSSIVAWRAAGNAPPPHARAPGPCRPSKFRLLVETLYSPGPCLSSFMPMHIEQPGSRAARAFGRLVDGLLALDGMGARGERHR